MTPPNRKETNDQYFSDDPMSYDGFFSMTGEVDFDGLRAVSTVVDLDALAKEMGVDLTDEEELSE